MDVRSVLRSCKFRYAAVALALLGGGGFGILLKRRADALPVVTELRELGGRVSYILEDTANLNAYDATISRFLNVDFVYSVDLTKCHLDGDKIKKLSVFPRLGSLNLKGTEVRSSDLAVLLALKELRWLDISDTSVDGDAVEWLSRMKCLEQVNLSGTAVTHEQIKDLQLKRPQLIIRVGAGRVARPSEAILTEDE